MANSYVGGIEGGATHSQAIIMDSSGQILGRSKGPGTNHHLCGMQECRKRLAGLIEAAKQDAGISLTEPLAAVGLSLSGCETEESNNELANGILKEYPNLTKKYVVASDTDGSVAATSNKGGVVSIAGTGSNTLLINPDGTKAQCGGWGNLLGDEGSAWKIAHTAVKYCFDDLDNYEKSPHPTGKVWDLVKAHFNIRTQPDILEYFYGKFDKPFISSLAAKISELAKQGDPLAQEIFRQAGVQLATSISAVLQKASPELTEREGGILITCVGSVWLSWDLLRAGFKQRMNKNENVKELTLVRLKIENGVGAVYLAADKYGFQVDRDYSKNYSVLYNYKRGKGGICNGACS